MEQAAPLISCIMPTRNRRRFVAQAVWYFLRQDYPRRELIVVDDGEKPVADLLPRDRRVRYVHLGSRQPLSAKRNLACSLSSGELIAHWDDDDWQGPARLSAQAAGLLAGGYDACAIERPLHYWLEGGQVWRRAAAGHAGDAHSGGLLYRRALWAEGPFAERGERAMLEQLAPGRLLRLDDSSLCVVVLHGANSTARDLAAPGWERRPFEDLAGLLGADSSFYAGLRHGVLRPRRTSPEPMTLAASFYVYDGYGSMAEYLALGLARAGADLHLAPLRLDRAGLSAELLELLARSHGGQRDTVLAHAWWGENLARFAQARYFFVKTAWETSRLPADWPARLNQARAVFIPSDWAARVFRESGVRVPVEAVYEGVDPELYHYCERPERETLTTLLVGVLAPRKNIAQAVAAWKRAFEGDPRARLLIKARFQWGGFTPDDPRITLVDSNEPTRGIGHWYEQADLLLALGNEGFGLPLVEGMATGLPAVVLDSEAQADVCAAVPDAVLPVRPARWQPVNEAPFGPCGVRAIPCVDSAAAQLRWAAEHRDEARAMGRAASEWVLANRDVWAMGPATLDLLEQHSSSGAPLRRSPVVWVSAPRGDELRLLAADLSAATGARLADAPPTPAATSSLTVLHRPGGPGELELADLLRGLRARGVPVLLVACGAGDEAQAWELAADWVGALCAEDAEHLRGRWPGREVALLPSGAPAWVAPRRRPGGRSVGLVAPPEERGTMLAALAAVPGTTAVLVGGDGLAAGTSRQVEAPSGAALARRLAAELDAVVCWPGEAGAPCYLARAALASGVPLLAPAGGYAELADAVYRCDDLAAGVARILGDGPLRQGLAEAARARCEALHWRHAAAAYHDLWRGLA